MRRRVFISSLAAGTAAGIAGCGSMSPSVNADPGAADIDDEYPPPTMGDGDTTVVLFQNYTCIGCRTYKEETHPQLIEEYVDSGEITYVNRHIPGPSPDTVDPEENQDQHEQLMDSWRATQAARAVQQEYDDDTFWEFSAALYEHAEEKDLHREFLGYDMSTIEATLDSTTRIDDTDTILTAVEENEFEDLVAGEQAFADEIADEIGRLATPSAVVREEHMVADFETISSAIDDGGNGLLPF